MATVMSPGGPLLQLIWSKIFATRLLPPIYTPEEWTQSFMDQARLQHVCSKVNSCRWGAWLGANAFHQQFRGDRLLVLLFYGISQGWFSEKNGAMVVGGLQAFETGFR